MSNNKTVTLQCLEPDPGKGASARNSHQQHQNSSGWGQDSAQPLSRAWRAHALQAQNKHTLGWCQHLTKQQKRANGCQPKSSKLAKHLRDTFPETSPSLQLPVAALVNYPIYFCGGYTSNLCIFCNYMNVVGFILTALPQKFESCT